MRPWERWRYPYTIGLPASGVVLLIGLWLMVASTLVLPGLITVLVALVAIALVGGYHRLWGERVTMWQRMDQVIGRHDRAWCPRRPSIIRTERGLVVTVGPVPALDESELTKALSEIAQTYGCRLVAHEILLPHGFRRRSVGRERVRWEMAR